MRCEKKRLEGGRWLHVDPHRVVIPGGVVQRGVADLALRRGRKFTLRFYVLVHGAAVYLHPRGICVVHGAPLKGTGRVMALSAKGRPLNRGRRLEQQQQTQQPQRAQQTMLPVLARALK